LLCEGVLINSFAFFRVFQVFGEDFELFLQLCCLFFQVFELPYLGCEGFEVSAEVFGDLGLGLLGGLDCGLRRLLGLFFGLRLGSLLLGRARRRRGVGWAEA